MAQTTGKRKTAARKKEAATKSVETKKTVKGTKSAVKTVIEPISVYINDIAKSYGMEVKNKSNHKGSSQGVQRILMCLRDHDGTTQLELTKQTGLSAPTVSVTLAKMESDGIIRREINNDDLRQVNVFMTEEGSKEYEAVLNCCNIVEEKMLQGFSDKDKETLKSYLKKIIDNLNN